MNQSSFIAGTVAVAFLIFITVRGELPKYAAVLVGGSTGSGSSTSQSDNEKAAEAVNTSVKKAGIPDPKTRFAKTADMENEMFKIITGGKLGLTGGDWSPSGLTKKLLGL